MLGGECLLFLVGTSRRCLVAMLDGTSWRYLVVVLSGGAFIGGAAVLALNKKNIGDSDERSFCCESIH